MQAAGFTERQRNLYAPPLAGNRARINTTPDRSSKIYDLILIVINAISGIGVGYGIANMQLQPCRYYPNWTCFFDNHEQYAISILFHTSMMTLILTSSHMIKNRIKKLY